jgi:Family of unknown function (DUF6585)
MSPAMTAAPNPTGNVAHGQTTPRWYGPLGAALMLPAAVALFVGIDALRADPADLVVGLGCLGGFVAVLVVLGVVHRAVKGEVQIDAQSITARFPSRAITIQWSEPHELRWRGVKMMKLGVPVVTTVSAEVRTPDGRRVTIADTGPLPGNPNRGLAEHIATLSTGAIWPKMQARLQAGETIDFGPLRLSRDALFVGGTPYARAQIQSTEVRNGRLCLSLEGKWLQTQVRLSDVPNFRCLLRALGFAI